MTVADSNIDQNSDLAYPVVQENSSGDDPMRPTSGVLLIVLVCMSSGCGTLLNLDGKEQLDFGGSDRAPDDTYMMKYQRPTYAFGGVGNDLAWIKSANQPIDVVAAILDMPFSLAGDIVTFPWVAYQGLIVVRPTPKEIDAPANGSR
jgi:uncharacterized protein YceK